MKMRVALLALIAICVANIAAAESLEKLADDFWTWRAKYAPFTGDDVNRLERPGGIRDWSRASIDQRRNDLKQFETRWKNIDPSSWPVSQQVDYKLIGSALSRVHWELDVNPRWKRDPNFYVEQSLTAIVEALVVPAPFDKKRSDELLTRIRNIPDFVKAGEENLENPPAPFAKVAIDALDGVDGKLISMTVSLVPVSTLKREELDEALREAGTALKQYRAWLQKKLPELPQETALGREAYVFFLKNVALLPYTPEQLLELSNQEWARSVAFEAYEENRNRN